MSAPTLTDQSVVSLREAGLVTTEHDGEITMLNIDAGKYYALPPVATAIWKRLQGGGAMQVGALCEALVAEYDVTLERCRQEVQAFLGQLLQENLLTVDAA